jgi:PAS domain S-box-containing protein
MRNEPLISRLSPITALVISSCFAAGIVILDLATGPVLNLAIFKSAVLLVCAASRRRSYLWAMTLALLITTYGVSFYELRSVADADLRTTLLINRTFTAITLIIVAGILHAWINSDVAAQVAVRTLQAQNTELADREEEITRQNEELQSQTEELERQSEELRVANEELAHREHMLETLLDLSRSMHVGLTEDAAMERICETLGQLVNGPGTAAAILLSERNGARVRCHYGFGPDGLQTDFIPTDKSFATLVMEQGRSAYLEDLALRPELQIPQPKVGPPMASVLATPLLVRGRAIGTLEVYAHEQRSWSDDQMALTESLAAQTSVSLENAQLFREIEDSRRRLATILESVPVGLAIANIDLSDVRFNPAGAAMIGVPPDVNVAEDVSRGTWKLFAEGKALGPTRFPIARAVSGERVYPHEMDVLLPTGRRLTVLSSATPFADARGRVIGGVSSFVDITQLKQLQRELETRRREAEEASVRKTRFLAAASHDIRTPANAISLLAELLKRTVDSPGLAAEIPQLADELRQSATSLVNLVSNILDVTRFDTDKLELHDTEFPLARLLEEETRQVLPLAQAKGLALDVEHADASLWLRADRIKLGRVLGNLLGNAIKFSDRGQISVATRRVDGELRISVSDTGIGINAENQKRIFDEFWQLSEPQRSKGSGLGLAISKRLMEAMGGDVVVQSEVGKGSVFTISMPASTITPHTDPDGSSSASPVPAVG